MRTDLNTIINENPNLILQVTASDLRYFLDESKPNSSSNCK